MKTSIQYSILSILLPVVLFLLPGTMQAQRLRHSTTVVTHSTGRGYYPPPRPLHPVPRPVPRPVPVPVPRPIPIIRPVPVPILVPIPAFHYPYFYHPFTPYYWGPAWHPIGFFVATLTTAAIIISVENASYHYDNGVYYTEESNKQYKVVPAPMGAEIPSLPKGYTKVVVSGTNYFYYGGAFYIQSGSKYKVVAAPPGAVISHLPEGTTETTVNGQKYVIYNGTYYEPVSQDGEDAYVVVETKSK